MASETNSPAEPGNFRTFAIALSAISISAVAGLTVVSVSALRSPSAEPTIQLVQGSATQLAQGQPQLIQEPYVPVPQQQTQPAALPVPPQVTGPSVEEMVRAAQEAAAAIAAGQPATTSQGQPSASSAPLVEQVVQPPSGPTLSELLAHPEAGPAILEQLSLHAGILAPGEVDNGNPIYAFMDPRCPYCHAAYRSLNGKFPIVWLPTLALGTTPEGEATIAGLLGETEAGLVQGRIDTVSLVEDPERLQRLDDVFHNQFRSSAEINDAQRFVIEQNLQTALQLMEHHNEPFGVPTFIIPRPDGTAVVTRGWDETGTMQTITDAYGAGS